jgi:hypothetical protein
MIPGPGESNPDIDPWSVPGLCLYLVARLEIHSAVDTEEVVEALLE